MNLSLGISLCVRNSFAQLELSALACSGLLGRALSLRLAMGDFPRWVDRKDVDSQAMYSAYLKYDWNMKQQFNDPAVRPIWWGCLHMVLHRMEDGELPAMGSNSGGLRAVSCQQRPCQRCENGFGGYQFRWYSRYWAKHYNDLARPGSWRAPGVDPSTIDDPSERFWAPVASSSLAPEAAA